MRLTRKPRAPLFYALMALVMVAAVACGSDAAEETTTTAAEETTTTAAEETTTTAAEETTTTAAALPEEIAGDGVLQVATSGAFPPMNYVADDGETVIGVAVDVMRAMADQVGLEVEMVVTDFAGILTGIESGRFDAGVIFVDTPERQEVVDILDVFVTGVQFLVPAAYEGPDVPECGSTIAAAAGSHELEVVADISQEHCEATGEDPYVVDEYPSNDNAALALSSGRADAFLTSATNAGFRVQQQPDEFMTTGPIYEPALTGIAFPKAHPDFTATMADAFQAVLDSGQYDEILAEWSLPDIAADQPYINTEPVDG